MFNEKSIITKVCFLPCFTDSKCPVRYGASCYYFVKERVTWQTALERCKIGGAQLVSIETAGENVFLQNYIRSRPDLNTKPANGRTKILC